MSVVALTRELARIPAPTGREQDRVRWLGERLREAPGRRTTDAVGNLVWTFGSPPYDVLLLVHVDTVFDASVDHEPVERDGWLCGPGVGDNSVAVATTVAVVEALAPLLTQRGAALAVAFTVGEEGLGGLRGARHACATLEADVVLALEGHGLDEVYTDAVGCLRAAVTVRGPGGHSWWDRGRTSATHALVGLLAELLAHAPPALALNVGTLEGGSAVNAVAAEARAVVEGRSLDERALGWLHDRLEGITADGVPDDGLAVDVEVLDHRPAGRLAADHALAAAVLEERRLLGLPPTLASGSTDANAALARGIPALALGCTRGRGMHTPAEAVDLSTVPLGAAQLTRVLRRLLGLALPAPIPDLEDVS